MQIAGKKTSKSDKLTLEDIRLLEELAATKNELDGARQKFQYVTEPEMIASCVYQVNSMEERYNFLLGQVRRKGLSVPYRGYR